MEFHDAWFFVGVFVFIFLVWAATGGPLHPLSFTGPVLAQPGVLGGGTYLELPKSAFTVGGDEVHLPDSSAGSGSTQTGTASPVPAPMSGVSFGDASLYRGLVSLSHSVSGAGSSDPRTEYLTVSVSQNAGIPIDISGWTLRSEASGNSISIPLGTDIPASGVVNASGDIILSPGEQALILSGRSPIGASFRENKCIGYFSSFQTFYPSLPQICPTPSSELSASYSDYIRDAKCIDYVNTLNRCQVVLTPPVTLSGSCQSFLSSRLNYNGCVSSHKADIDFNGSTWRVYLGRTTPMWRTQHEVVKLIDAKGKTVDMFSY